MSHATGGLFDGDIEDFKLYIGKYLCRFVDGIGDGIGGGGGGDGRLQVQLRRELRTSPSLIVCLNLRWCLDASSTTKILVASNVKHEH